LLFLASLACASGLLALYTRLRSEYPRSVSGVAVALIFGATSLLWYTLFEPSVTETAAFGLLAWHVVLAERWSQASVSAWRGWVLGTLLGAATLIRPANAVVGIATLMFLFTRRLDGADRARSGLRAAAWIALGVTPWFIGRLALSTPGSFDSSQSSWLDVLFSSWHGFLSLTPIVYFAVLGTIGYLRRNRPWARAALIVLVAVAWINGATGEWANGPAFGARSMIGVLPLVTPGLAYGIDLLRRKPALALAPLVIAALLWNRLLMVQYTVGLLPKDEPVSFARLVQQQADLQVRASRFYPFAFPANIWFAWREVLLIDRYDLLAFEPRRANLDLVMDRKADRYLLEGWDAPGVDGAESVWWINGRTATLAVPLVLPQDRAVLVTVKARSRFEEPVVIGDLALQVNGHEVGQLSPGAAAPTEAQIIVPATPARALWRDGFNKIAFVSRGTHRVDPGDTRPPGPLARRAGRPAWPVAIYRIAIEPK